MGLEDEPVEVHMKVMTPLTVMSFEGDCTCKFNTCGDDKQHGDALKYVSETG